jgi:acyl dehydratase
MVSDEHGWNGDWAHPVFPGAQLDMSQQLTDKIALPQTGYD